MHSPTKCSGCLGKVVYVARASDKLPVQERFYDEKGKWVRTMTFSNFKKMDDRVIPTEVSVKVAENKRQSTTIKYHKILFNRVIADSTFSQDLLRRTAVEGKTLAAGWSTDKTLDPTNVTEVKAPRRRKNAS